MSIVFAEADGFHRGQNTLLKTLYAIISLCSIQPMCYVSKTAEQQVWL